MNPTTLPGAALTNEAAPSARVSAIYRRITWRLIPFLFVCYVAAYLDRINIGFAQIQMRNDLGFSDAVYGLGAGIFFAGYFLFEVRKRTVRILDLKRVFSITRGFEHGKDEESDGAGDIRQPARV
ncbi:hypothetical protein [Caballeronia cordobensis]|uniref:hypothetical protein n=1 Tax=Caballeronia cordobensis TaxID=1353886 RepID=UPI00045EF51E|nr:putative permease [Burkholderia sp. RPE67]